MSGALSKRQQARNERTLQDLIKTVPGNNVCADCQARNPGWASWSLGIFLCMRCAALHRKMGVHITKVKSLSMDSWSNDQVENMKRMGNIASNRVYNPQNAKPPIPFDADEADSAMERFIRQKYMERTVKTPLRNNTGSTNSDDQPPPLPPKTGGRFGFRSASSIFPLSSKNRRDAARADFENSGRRTPSPPRNKQSRVFGASVGDEDPQDLDLKMAKLRDMGFRDEKRSLAVLKGLGGNLEKSIETLVRLGDSGTGGLKPAETGSTTRSRSPMSATAGLTINRPREETSPQSANPFDMLDAPPPPPMAQPQSSQSTGSMAHAQSQMMGNNPYQQTQNSNPFGLMPSHSQYSLNQAFQNMSVTNSQPLFPNHTGGFPGPQHPQNHHLYQQSMTPPVPSLPQQYYPSVIYENPAQQPVQNTNYNPFLQQQTQPQMQQPPPINTNFQNNPYNQQASTPQNLYQSPFEQSPNQQYSSTYYGNNAQQMNPFLNQDAPPQQMNPYLNQPNARQQTYPLMPQQTGRADKRSILDLYNYPQLAPTPLHQAEQGQGQALSQSANSGLGVSQQQRSVSSPLAVHVAGSKNPFASSGRGAVQNSSGDAVGNMAQFAPKQNGPRHASQESTSVDAGGWHNGNGRHSPDAWGSISARSLR